MAQQAPPSPAKSFKFATVRNYAPLPDLSLTNVGQQASVDLLQVGYLAYLWVTVYGTITTGTGATGTFDPNYWPYNLLGRLALRSNEGLEIYNTKGYHNLFAQMYHRIGYNPSVPNNPLSFNSGTQGARTSIQYAPTGAVSASTAYKVGVTYMIPIVSHPDLRAGLILLQNQVTRLTMYPTLGQATDWLGAAGSLGAGATIALTVRTSMEYFSVPADPASQPNLQYIHRIIGDTQPWTASGDFIYKVPVNGTILRVWKDFHNGTVPANHYSAANDPTSQQFFNTTVQYAGSQKPEIEDAKFRHIRHRLNYNQDLPNGALLYDFSVGGGSIEVGADARDAYNTQAMTEFALITNTSIAPAGNSFVDVIRQELQKRAA